MKLCLYNMEMCVMPILLSIQFDAICDRWSYSVFIGNANVRMFADPSAIWLQLLLFCYFVFCFSTVACSPQPNGRVSSLQLLSSTRRYRLPAIAIVV